MKLGGRKMDPPNAQNIRGWKFRDHPFQPTIVTVWDRVICSPRWPDTFVSLEWLWTTNPLPPECWDFRNVLPCFILCRGGERTRDSCMPGRYSTNWVIVPTLNLATTKRPEVQRGVCICPEVPRTHMTYTVGSYTRIPQLLFQRFFFPSTPYALSLKDPLSPPKGR